MRSAFGIIVAMAIMRSDRRGGNDELKILRCTTSGRVDGAHTIRTARRWRNDTYFPRSSWSIAVVFRAILLVLLSTAMRSTVSFSTCTHWGRIESRQVSWMVSSKRRKKRATESSRAKEPIGLSEFDFLSSDDSAEKSTQEYRPIPSMPSQLFVSLAQSQLELLAHSLSNSGSSDKTTASTSKIKSMALYLPQENVKTGQLEFLPAVLYPPPSSERVFIASGANSGVAPSLPKALTKLPGFAHATSLLPGYPMVTSSSDGAAAGVGEPEEVMCDPQTRAAALSVPLFSGSQTVGVLLVSPCAPTKRDGTSTWTLHDKEQVSRAAQSLSLALSMDSERSALQEQTNQFRATLSDSLHQVKNPLQALRTYGKLLQRRIANSEDGYESRFEFGQTPQLLALADHLMVQSDRVVDLLLPMDSLVAETAPSLYLNPSAEPEYTALTRWQDTSRRIPWSNETEEFSNEYKQVNQRAADLRQTSNSSDYPPERLSSPQPGNGHRPTSSLTSVGDAEMEMAFVQDVLEPILSGFEVIASERGIGFVVIEDDDELPGVVVSPKSLQEAVVNVIDNAFKYVVLPKPGCGFTRNPSPRVRVRLMANRKPYAAGATILVEDNGPGIPAEEQCRIFERGFRGETTSSVEGSGIGLDITNSLISRMGGVVEVAQGDENGSLDGAIIKLVLFRIPDV